MIWGLQYKLREPRVGTASRNELGAQIYGNWELSQSLKNNFRFTIPRIPIHRPES